MEGAFTALDHGRLSQTLRVSVSRLESDPETTLILISRRGTKTLGIVQAGVRVRIVWEKKVF